MKIELLNTWQEANNIRREAQRITNIKSAALHVAEHYGDEAWHNEHYIPFAHCPACARFK